MARHTFTLQEIAADYLPPQWTDGARWLSRKLNKGEIKGVKLGRSWVMTQAQIDAMLDTFSNEVVEPEPEPESTETTGISFSDALSSRSRARLRKVDK